jgi:hypothetical protein
LLSAGINVKTSDARRASSKAWKQRNRGYVLAYAAEWAARHPERRRSYASLYNEFRRGTPHGRAAVLLNVARQRAEKKGLEFSLTLDWLEPRIVAGVCEVTGLPFDLATQPTNKGPSIPFSPSLDRIDNSRGYSEDNVQVVVSVYNVAKGAWGHDAVVRMAESLCSPR